MRTAIHYGMLIVLCAIAGIMYCIRMDIKAIADSNITANVTLQREAEHSAAVARTMLDQMENEIRDWDRYLRGNGIYAGYYKRGNK